SADPRASGSVHMMYEIMLQAYGWEKGIDVITRIGANVRSFPDSSSRIPKDVTGGELACGLAIDIYAWAQIDEAGADKIGYVMPEGQTVINADSIAILRGAPHREAAERFVQFVLSEDGQSLLMLPPGAPGGPSEFQLARMCILPALYDTLSAERVVKTNPFEQASSLAYDSVKGSLRYDLVNDLVGALIIDTHDDLLRAWEAIRRGGMREEALAKLTEPPLPEEEALELARWKWDDDEARNVERSRWRRLAGAKYEEAYRLSGGARPDRLRAVGRVVRLAVPLAAGLACALLLCDLVVRGLRGLLRRRSRA
ncbi:MAG: ABC transporter substrate-binding protein, partial [Armatimonadota bacterium]